MDELGKLRQKVEELKRYERIVETTRNPVGLVDQDYVYQYVNQSYCDALRKQQDEIIQATWEFDTIEDVGVYMRLLVRE